ncbi:hypothetical protein FOMPIDRAFT_1053046 [Fomitopsis schrenkii]|uniref:RNase H type-1 domain-containing protein n=1 Tax=Fomitopsis schrenkii TaxID=2126942 RepID=S8F4T7_FOMSC|nr:hypothetical protein FOMPIDRAFT_1053046 [Fomitopsis schrenkii]
MGIEAVLHMSILVDDAIDPGAKRTSQRAELLAAILGLRALRCLKGAGEAHPADRRSWRRDADADVSCIWILATDSYDEATPASLTFLEPDEEITAAEAKHDILVGFWYIPRKYNTVADRLAKDAAKRASIPAPSCTPTFYHRFCAAELSRSGRLIRREEL